MTTIRTEGPSVAQALGRATRRLADAGIETARLDARLMLSHATGRDRLHTLTASDDPLSPGACERFEGLIERRLRHEPVSHLTGLREFWSLPLSVNGDVLDPRPDSETLVEAALGLFPDAGADLSVLDLGTGSGCLLLAVLHERPRARGLGIDLSERALGVARANAARLGLAERACFARADWGEALAARFDLILCNPPYIASGDIASLAPEVARFEPSLALDGGSDGLAAYRAILPRLGALLAHEGRAILEVGAGQAASVHGIAADAGLDTVATRYDLSGTERCVELRCSGVFTVT